MGAEHAHGLHAFFLQPFQEYLFLRKALIGCGALSLSCGPVGVFLILRRMSLMGDALSHGLLPGVALAFFFCGFSLPAMTLGGGIAGLLVALLAGLATRVSILHEDANFAGFYLISMALGVLILSISGNQIDLMHVLFGTVLSISAETLILLASITSFSLIVLSLIYRPLLIECFDPQFFRSVGGNGSFIHFLFLILVTLNLVGAFQALGTLMALGLLLLPAISARLWTKQVWTLCFLAIFLAFLSSYLGLLFSFHFAWPSGPAIVLVAGAFYLISLLVISCRKFLWKFSFFFALLMPSFGEAASAPLKIVASFSILGNFVEEIAGNTVELHVLVGPNADAHVYEPKPQDLKLLTQADVVIINGMGFERWMDRLIQSSGYRGPVVNASQGVTPRILMAGGQKILDPHAWHDLKNAQIYVDNIAKTLSQTMPHFRAFFEKRAALYAQKLEKKERWIRQEFSQIPPSKKRAITNHDGFGYLGLAYQVEFFAPFGLSTEGDPSAFGIAQLIRRGAHLGIQCAFIENISNPALVQQIAKEAHIKVGGVLYSDALSPLNGPAPTYLDMVNHNISTLIEGMR